ncbi:hypothetical protein SteCoe_7578 [Stentor coeruleus]|uniref:Uncharacterized protein n=1 Tax=Stentor coeruleus TaxID=5963 RepID=A0A1R2CM46_9CILI|nr:hypothetical protein SteCoe_7578 [Stentor coeruleus]
MEEQGWTVEEMKQNLALLRKAVRTERVYREQQQNDYKKIAEAVHQAEQDLKNKIIEMERLSLVNQDLEHQMRNMNLLGNLNENIQNDSRSFYILEQTNQKLSEDIGFLIMENDNLSECIKELELDIEEKSKHLTTNNENIKQEIQSLRTQISELNLKTSQHKKDKHEIQLETNKTRERHNNLDSILLDLSSTIFELSEKHSSSKKQVESVREYEKEMVDKLATHIQIENDMATELLKYRSIVAEARSSYQKFSIKRIWMIMTTNVVLILRKGTDGKHVLQVTDGKKVMVYSIADVDAVFMHPTKSNRFFLKVNEEVQEYESEMAVKIMQLIRELVFSDFNERD